MFKVCVIFEPNQKEPFALSLSKGSAAKMLTQP